MQLRRYYRASKEDKHLVETNPTKVGMKSVFFPRSAHDSEISSKIINDAVENAKPLMNIESVKVGAVVYQVPTPISEHNATFRGIKWLVE